MAGSDPAATYETMSLIRGFETRILELFAQGELNGTTHTYVGQEANATAIIPSLDERDIVFSSHRCHGHYLARFKDPEPLFAELMGRITGVCGGRGGSQHLCRDNFYSNGIQGGYMPIAAGMALAEKRSRSGAIVVPFIGDGTLGEGAIYEALNMASLWRLPMLVVVENNRYAQTTPVELAVAGSMAGRFAAFGIEAAEIESNDIDEILPLARRAIEDVRNRGEPRALVLHTYRLNAHSKGDDFRDPEEIAVWRAKDPLRYVASRLEPRLREEIEVRVEELLDRAEAAAREAPEASDVGHAAERSA